ncbi:MAG: MFS transporter [Candidatus Asgardarchaeia archaeon]
MGLLEKIRSSFSFFHGNALVITVSWIFIVFSNRITAIYFSEYLQVLGATPFIIGIMYTVYLYLVSISRVIGGYISDKWGRRKIICMMTYVLAFVQLIYAFAPSWEWIFAAFIITAFTLVYQTALDAMIADSLPAENRGFGFSVVYFFSYLPSIAAPFLAIYLIVFLNNFEKGVRLAFVLSFFLTLTAAIIRTKFLTETLENIENDNFKSAKELFKDFIAKFYDALKKIDRPLAMLIIAYGAYFFASNITSYFWILYALDVIGLSIVEWGYVSWAGVAIGIILMMPIGIIVEKIGRLRSFIIGAFGSALFGYFYLIAKDFQSALISYTMISLSMLLLINAFVALRADMMPREYRGRMMAAATIALSIVNAPSGIIGGYLYEYISPELPFLIFIGLSLFTAVFALLTVREPKERYE